MNNEERITNNEEHLNIPHPDPAWDYYTVWHSCLHIRAKMDEALEIIQHVENATPEVDIELYNFLDLISDKLRDILDDLDSED